MAENKKTINIIGAGLAGAEAALLLANYGQKVILHEMKPNKKSPAHHIDTASELVCSNSLRSNRLENAVGLLKEELRLLNSPLMKIADQTSVPAGGALAVDRLLFSQSIENSLQNHPNIEYKKNSLIKELDKDAWTIIATGPMTDPELFDFLINNLGLATMHFFDAAAPIIAKESLNMNKVYQKSRYDKGEADYLNCPMTEEEYNIFYESLINAELAEVKDFDKEAVFEGCMPIEVMAKRGKDTMRFGPLKPVGLETPDGKLPYAVVQLRQDDSQGNLYNIVGFQTRLKFKEQKRVFGLIPGLENAEIMRYGVMHKNTFLQSPGLLSENYQNIKFPKWFFAGQITGVEGYVESMASGHYAARSILLKVLGVSQDFTFDSTTVLGSMAKYISNPSVKNFQPMNANFGLLANLDKKYKKDIKIQKYIERALNITKEKLAEYEKLIAEVK